METKTKTLSISIAAYNLGEKIRPCLDSFIKSAHLEKIEVIVTDDGSKDNTPDIVQEYVDRFPGSIILIRKSNEGPGSTVNSGINKASGKYFRMVDGDDEVNTEEFDKLVAYLEKCETDMVVTDFDYLDDKTKRKEHSLPSAVLPFEEKKIDEVFDDLRQEMHGVTFKTSLLKDHHIHLDNCFYTDVEYVLLPIPFVNSVLYLPYTVYVYRINQTSQSVSSSSLKRNFSQHESVFKRLTSMYEENKASLSEGQKGFMAKRLGEMGYVHVRTMLLFEKSKANKKAIKQFCRNLKQNHPDIYGYLLKSQAMRLLIRSGYLAYGYLSRYFKRVLS